jgi:methylated-DNA-[protein]-cysteine S-methyltransferase
MTRTPSSRRESAELAVEQIETPIGPLTAVVDDRGRLVGLEFSGRSRLLGTGEPGARARAGLERVAAQLREYFAGKRRKFTFPLAPRGTEFQQRVWDELLRIPYGATVSYGELAARVGNPAAQRAVARANATNPIAVVVPCHRVIGADGTLTGYGGGLDKKRRLLELEGALLPMTFAARQ